MSDATIKKTCAIFSRFWKERSDAGSHLPVTVCRAGLASEPWSVKGAAGLQSAESSRAVLTQHYQLIVHKPTSGASSHVQQPCRAAASL